MAITAAAVNELRKMTGAGMMDCKKALTEVGGDFEAAIDLLRKKGQKISANRADRDATEGAVIALASDDSTVGVIVRLSCETDFVAKNADFIALADNIAKIALENKAADLDALKALSIDGQVISERLTEEMGKIGEKIDVSKYDIVSGASVINYIHAGNRIGVLVELSLPTNDDISAAGKDVAMQIAAMNPVSVGQDDIPADVIERELEIGREQARAEGKPEQIIEKIAMGKLNKFYKENTLTKQSFVKDTSVSVEGMLKGIDADLKVSSFSRIALG
ncbi:MAG: elongation factor Ts [Bacteroidetes bacterium]|jgi:elongation factor Ts|nr:elongation factor Ts [Bacteroidota bacterium]